MRKLALTLTTASLLVLSTQPWSMAETTSANTTTTTASAAAETPTPINFAIYNTKADGRKNKQLFSPLAPTQPLSVEEPDKRVGATKTLVNGSGTGLIAVQEMDPQALTPGATTYGNYAVQGARFAAMSDDDYVNLRLLYRPDRFKLADTTKPVQGWGTDNVTVAGCTDTKKGVMALFHMTDKWTDISYVVANVHLSTGSGDACVTRRQKEMDLQMSRLEAYLDDAAPWARVIVAGDFNQKESLTIPGLKVTRSGTTYTRKVTRLASDPLTPTGNAQWDADDSNDTAAPDQIWVDTRIAGTEPTVNRSRTWLSPYMKRVFPNAYTPSCATLVTEWCISPSDHYLVKTTLTEM